MSIPEESHQDFVDRKRRARMAMVDSMTPELRELVHEYGLTVVKAFTDCGVTRPKHIRHLVERVLDEFSPSRGSFSSQGVRVPLLDHAALQNKQQEHA